MFNNTQFQLIDQIKSFIKANIKLVIPNKKMINKEWLNSMNIYLL
jgi:hypothetical protein